MCAAFDLPDERIMFESSNVALRVSGVFGSDRFTVGLDNVKGLFQISSVILCLLYTVIFIVLLDGGKGAVLVVIVTE